MRKSFIFLIAIFISLISLILYCSKKKEIPKVKPIPKFTLGKVDDKHESFYRPRAVCVDSKSNIYVLDSGNNRIVKFDKDGNFLLEFGRFGQGPGEFTNPTDLDIDKDDLIYVLDTGNRRVQIFNNMGNKLGGFKVRGIVFLFAARLALDRRDRIYINHVFDGKLIDVYNKNGDYLGSIGEVINFDNRQPIENQNIAFFDFDKNDNMYLLFFSIPIVRMYDQNYKLIWERKIFELSGVQASLRNINEMKKRSPYMVFGIFADICVFPNGDYLIGSSPLYHFNSKGYLIQEIDISPYRIVFDDGDKSLLCIIVDEINGWKVMKVPFPKS